MRYEFVEVVAIVKREAKSEASPEEAEWLHRSENVTLWKEALAAAIADVCDQFAHQKERLDRVREDTAAQILPQASYDAALVEYEAWKKKASRYRLGLEHRLREVRSAERTRNVLATDAAKNLMALLEAVEEHRATVLDQGEPDQWDLVLWDSITGVVAF